MTDADKLRVQQHVRKIASELFNQKLSLREKQLLVMLGMCVGALEDLDELLTNIPPDLYFYPVDQFKQWQRARDVAEVARDLHVSMLGFTPPGEEPR